jgi:hypothetical protein
VIGNRSRRPNDKFGRTLDGADDRLNGSPKTAGSGALSQGFPLGPEPTEDVGHHTVSPLAYEASRLADIFCGRSSIGQAGDVVGDLQIKRPNRLAAAPVLAVSSSISALRDGYTLSGIRT